jgi:hypothetical protein
MNSRYSNENRAAAAVREALHQFLDLLAAGVARKLIEQQCRSGLPAKQTSSDAGLECERKPSSTKRFEND